MLVEEGIAPKPVRVVGQPYKALALLWRCLNPDVPDDLGVLGCPTRPLQEGRLGGRTRPVTVDSGQKQAIGTLVSGGERYTRAREARRWSRAKVKWEMSVKAVLENERVGERVSIDISVSGTREEC